MPRRLSAWILASLLLPVAGALRAQPETLPPDSVYVSVSPESQLVSEGRRVRFWGAVAGNISLDGTRRDIPPELRFSDGDDEVERAAKTRRLREGIDAFADRVAALGFNLVRFWDSHDWTAPYEKGDGSRGDMFAYAAHAFERRGVRLWATQLGSVGRVTPEDVAVLDDPATADAWREAIAGMANTPFTVHTGAHLREQADVPRGNPPLGGILADAWDPRLQALRLKRQERAPNFRNVYKDGLRLGDDPQVAVWELSNEEWWFTHMINGRWQRLPAFFQQSLHRRWVEFLRAKYRDDAGLRSAWDKLFAGESIAGGFVMLAPLASPVRIDTFTDANPAALAAQRVEDTPQRVTREDCSARRASDVIEFLMVLHRDWKARQHQHVKTLGKSLRLAPLVHDTGDEWRIQSAWMQQHADAMAMVSYGTGFSRKADDPLFPWSSYLRGAPSMSSAADRVAGKPYFVYETNTLNPSKYRAEFPYVRALEGVVQDIDIIVWHTFPRPRITASGPIGYGGAMPSSRPDFGPGGYEFGDDEVRVAAMVTAGAIFKSAGLPPARSPATIVWGRESILDPGSTRYGYSYGEKRRGLAAIAAAQGIRHRYDLDREEDEVSGQRAATTPPGVLRPTEEIEYDRNRWHLRVDSPTAVAYTGFLAKLGGPLGFKNGVRAEKVVISNPPGMPYPVREDERFISFALVSTDGLELAKSKRARLTLVSTSFNEGMVIDEKKMAETDPWHGGRAVSKTGGRQLVARVGATLFLPPMRGAAYRMYDFNGGVVAQGSMSGDRLEIRPNQPAFYVEFTRP